MKRIRLKDQIKTIESCTAINCPCYACFIDTGDYKGELKANCNLGATIKIDRDGWPIEDGVFPDDCPREEEVQPSMELTDENVPKY